MDPAVHKDEPELGVFVLPVLRQMPPDCHCFLNQVVQILQNFRRKPYTNPMHKINHRKSTNLKKRFEKHNFTHRDP